MLILPKHRSSGVTYKSVLLESHKIYKDCKLKVSLSFYHDFHKRVKRSKAYTMSSVNEEIIEDKIRKSKELLDLYNHRAN